MTAFLFLLFLGCISGTKVLLSRPTPLPQCLSLNNTVSANVSDPTSIFVGGGGIPHSHEHSVMFMSSQYAYLIHVDADSGAMDVQQAPMGRFQSTTGVVGAYLLRRIPLILHVIPSGTSDLHFLAINDSVLYDYAPPWSLAQILPSGFVPSASATRVVLGAHYVEDLLFASVDTVVRLCTNVHNPFRPVFGHAVFNLSANFDNPLGVDQTTVIQVDRHSNRAYILRSRSGSSPQDSGEVIVLKLENTHCRLVADNRVFVQPQPVSLTVIAAIHSSGADVFWPMSPDPHSSDGADGRLYRWNLEDVRNDRTAVANLSLNLGPNDVIAQTGFTPIWSARGATFWGVVVSQTPGDTDVGATLVDADDGVHGRNHRFEVVCQDKLPMALPTAAARTGDAARSLVFASDSGQFTLVNVPYPKVSSSVDVVTRAGAAREEARGFCPAFSFGLPNTCSACTPPNSLCGLTEHCASGCCFVSGGRVMCCTQSPPGTTTAGFSCANK